MKKLIHVIIAAVIFAGCQNRNTNQKKGNEDQIVIGTVDSVYSNILDETRKIWVHVPAIAMPDSGKIKYPVLYLLDGDGHFSSVTGMVEQLSTINGNTIMPETIVVGIPNTDRTRDLTPTHVAEAFGDSSFVKTSGGGDEFLDFIQKELIPYVKKNYPASEYRTFVGHSFGGLTVVYALLTRPEIFDNYVAIDPSLWWDDLLLIKMADSIFANENFNKKSLFTGVANTMPEGMDIATVVKDTTTDTQHIRSILQFVKSAELSKEKTGLNFGWKYYNDDDHGSVPLITEYDAIRFLFPWYRLKGLDRFFMPETNTTAQDVIDVINSHFATVAEHMGGSTAPPEALINTLGYGFMNSKMPEKAFAMFQMNLDNYPKSNNVWDSMGDYYLAQSDTLKAVEHFAKAVELGNTTYSKEKLEKYRKVN